LKLLCAAKAKNSSVTVTHEAEPKRVDDTRNAAAEGEQDVDAHIAIALLGVKPYRQWLENFACGSK
jgi:hypothetical protein